MNRETLKKSLASEFYQKIIKDAAQIGEKEKVQLKEEYEQYKNLFLQGTEDICDDEDYSYFIAIKYVEIKANWIQNNLRLNYQAVFKGSADQLLLIKAGLLSHFLSLVEPSVEEKHLSLIQDLLATRLAA